MSPLPGSARHCALQPVSSCFQLHQMKPRFRFPIVVRANILRSPGPEPLPDDQQLGGARGNSEAKMLANIFAPEEASLPRVGMTIERKLLPPIREAMIGAPASSVEHDC